MVEHPETNLDPQEDQIESAVKQNVEEAATDESLSSVAEETKESLGTEEKLTENTAVDEPAGADIEKEKPAKAAKARKHKSPTGDAEPAAPVVEKEFDWEKYEEGSNFYTKSERQRFEKLYNDTLSAVKVNEVVEGTVISMNKREVVINIGYKSEGVVSLNEFRYNPELGNGDKVEVYVESQEDKKGQLVLSHKKARALKSWM
ncbi:MAG: ribosomal protein [Bacteroidetes bacterium]|nr:ribosomal protein [Bacteroidota bacterium]